MECARRSAPTLRHGNSSIFHNIYIYLKYLIKIYVNEMHIKYYKIL